MDTTTPDWTSLPDHLLASIAGHLPTRIDNLRCRAVCKSSRSSIPSPPKPLSPHANLKISMPSLPVPGCRGHLVLAEFTFYAIKPLPSIFNPHQTTYTWLVKSEELHSGKVRLEDPLSRSRLGNLSNKSWHRRNQQFEFKVYKFDEEKREWVEVMDGLDDSVFFVGDDDSFSLSAKEFPGCKGNCVYFKEADPFKVSDCHPGTDGWIFDLKDGTVGGLSAFPGYSNIFRPRPTWVE
ncbi:putative F-box protein At1g65770 isoform X2 [Pistacia vera]|uniref:putative F-box protein At1g65770 isoform X2 n=1 Tax=Pistacia vera TaxID=55513 RepID=UPI0012637A3B|nr:putative F-box protein At1g65770 isoform X2 [Pistacia vera]